MTQEYVLSFAEGVTVDMGSVDCAVIRTPFTPREYAFRIRARGLRRVIEVLSSTGEIEGELTRQVEERDGAAGLPSFYYCLLAFAERSLLCYGIRCGDRRLATLVPTSMGFRFSPGPVKPQSIYTLSRFAYLHRERADLILESPLTHCKVTLHDAAGATIAAGLAKAQTLNSLYTLLPDLSCDVIELFLQMLVGVGFASELKPDELDAGEDEVLAQWDFHDLLFHARSRLGRHANALGGTYRFRNKVKPLPAVKEFDAEETINLYRPDISSLEKEDPPFTLVLERRKSLRDYGRLPITDRQLGEFLYRSARVKEDIKMDLQDLSRRPYPGGGAIYELELYLNIHACENIPHGLYHYCPKFHRLERIFGPPGAAKALLRDAARSARMVEMPQILITIAARFQRLSWKYESMAYSALLKNVGVLYQTMYLVATAIGLAPCALGTGDSDLFATAVGLNYYAETSVGEFLLGSKRE
jgi:SagB-type dehydrogenase family enzyme